MESNAVLQIEISIERENREGREDVESAVEGTDTARIKLEI